MVVVYVLSHFDDEYCALPLLLAHQRAGDEQHFVYMADYATPALSDRRRLESCRFLARWGLQPARIHHLGRCSGVRDGAIYRGLDHAYQMLEGRLSTIGQVEKLVAPAWEGGHMDHDACAALAVRLAGDLSVPVVQQFSLYNGRGLPGPLFRAANPLAQGGPARRLPFAWGDMVRWALDVRFFPSQAKTWIGLWPVMFASLIARGFRIQTLAATRVRERPHAGPLLYERMYGVPYADVRAAVDAFLDVGGRPGRDD